ncbi:MAG: hypothetical protein JRN15_05595, partial [Nitrososphaerota archaeon]|nr:hypothetical protein [Nitrososphaerota archaeon]
MSSAAFRYRYPAQTNCDFEDPTVTIPKPPRLKYESLPDIHNIRYHLSREMQRLDMESMPADAKGKIR